MCCRKHERVIFPVKQCEIGKLQTSSQLNILTGYYNVAMHNPNWQLSISEKQLIPEEKVRIMIHRKSVSEEDKLVHNPLIMSSPYHMGPEIP